MPAGGRYGGQGRYFNNNNQNRQPDRRPNNGPQRNGPPPKPKPDVAEKNEQEKKAQVKAPSPVKAPPTAAGGAKSEPVTPSKASHDAPIQPENKRPERKFTQRSRLFVGNLPIGISDDDFKGLFSPYGEISEIFVNSDRGFGFVRLDTRANAEKAKWELDNSIYRNRQLRVRFATHGAALSIKNLTHHVSNELLEEAFSQFGQVERAVVVVDDKGRSLGRGIVEFARKSSATKALAQIRDGCFLLTASPRAIAVCPLEQEDTEDGLAEKNINKTREFFQERDAPPRFAQPGTFEEEFARRWKALDDLEKQQRDQLEKSIQASREKLEAEMENSIHEHQAMLMKQDLLRRQEELERLEDARKRELERRQQLELARQEAHNKEMEAIKQRQDLLRAQIEGGYKAHDHGPSGPQRGGFDRQGGAGNQDFMAQDTFGGQGGLGPAPDHVSSRFDQGRDYMGGPPQHGNNPNMGYGHGMRGGYEGGPQSGFGRGGNPNGQRRPAREQEAADINQKRRRF